MTAFLVGVVVGALLGLLIGFIVVAWRMDVISEAKASMPGAGKSW